MDLDFKNMCENKVIYFNNMLFLFQFEDEEPDGGTLQGGRKRLFSKELRCMMYGFGDDQNPYTESVDLLEDLVIEFITDMVCCFFTLAL